MGSRLGRVIRLAAKVTVWTVLTLALLTALTRSLLPLLNQPKAFQGYTLIAPLRETRTYLTDMQGRVVRTWESDYAAGQDARLLENGHLLRAGQIRDTERLFSSPTTGGRVQEFTWDGELVWDFKLHNEKQVPHHDFARLPNGNILLIVWEIKNADESLAAGRRPELVKGPWLADSVLEIMPKGRTIGEIVWQWYVWDHLIQDQDPSKANYGSVASHPELIDINFGEMLLSQFEDDSQSPQGDAGKWKHLEALRSIGYLGSRTTKKNPGVIPDWTHINAIAFNPEFDQIILTVRAFSEFWIIDHSTTSTEAKGHTGGRSGKGGDLLYRWGNPRAHRAGTVADQRLFVPHDAHWIPRDRPGKGHVLVFNNGLGRPGGDYSSVDELVLPVDDEGRYTCDAGGAYGPIGPIWSYTAPRKSDFTAGFLSGAQRLPNGNTLICDGVHGTLFEVTRDGLVAWHLYVSAMRSGADGLTRPPGGNPLFRAHRYAADYPGLADKELSPQR